VVQLLVRSILTPQERMTAPLATEWERWPQECWFPSALVADLPQPAAALGPGNSQWAVALASVPVAAAAKEPVAAQWPVMEARFRLPGRSSPWLFATTRDIRLFATVPRSEAPRPPI
jgi:hypothetical protein